MINGVSMVWVIGGLGGGCMSLDHVVLWFIGVFIGVGGIILVNIVGICRR